MVEMSIGSIECVVCEGLVKEVEKLIETNKTEVKLTNCILSIRRHPQIVTEIVFNIPVPVEIVMHHPALNRHCRWALIIMF